MRPARRLTTSLAALSVLLAACFTRRPVELTPAASGTPVRVTFAVPRDFVFGRTGGVAGDSILLRGVRRLEGRLDGRVGDTLLLRPLTRAVTTAGEPAPPEMLRVRAARVVLGDGVTATGTGIAFSPARTALLVLGIVAFIAFAVSQIEFGLPDSGGGSF